jgi:hypothetical protein
MTDAIHCPCGLGNRVAAMANGLSRAESIRFNWPVNAHCPVSAYEMFPGGVPGVEFLPGTNRPEPPTRWGGLLAHCWDAAADRQRANQAYAEIMAAMVGTPMWRAPEVAILGRFHRNPGADPIALADAAISRGWADTWGGVFVMSDCHRDLIAARFAQAGFRTVMPQSRPLPHDLERTRDDVLDYACDWATLLSARRIVALDGPASALHPARAAGIEIIHA